jgi:Neuraminidase (sialidase)
MALMLVLILLALAAAQAVPASQSGANPRFDGATIIPLLPPGPGNPRNTEGSFVTLRDGRILFAYTRFTGGTGDHDAASIVGRYSSDGGRTWTGDDVPMVAGEGAMNVMSVSLLRLQDGRIALFYLRKNSVTDCLPCMRYSRDEAKTWSDPAVCVPAEGYYVLNNDRAVQLRSGRIVLPVAYHHPPAAGQFGSRGVAMAFLSDDGGTTWRSSRTRLHSASPDRAGFQEPGVIELKDGRVMMFIRTQLGSQYLSFSDDGGDTWTEARASDILSPLSPASIERIPSTGDLLMVWNDHSGVEESFRSNATRGGKRTPLTVAISRDDGRSWIRKRNLLDDPDGWYCYIAIHFDGPRVLLGFVAGGSGLPPLSRTSIAVIDVKRLYR